MNGALQIGPLALPYTLLLTLGALVLAWVIGVRSARARGVDVEPLLVRMLLVGLVVARLAFVWQWRGPYLAHPGSILDVRDGGWALEEGLAAAALYGFYRARSDIRLRRPVFAVLLTAAAVYAGGTIALLAAPRPASGLPALALAAPDGSPVSLAVFTGKPLVVNLWASWCGPCQREIPLLAQAQSERPEVNFVFVNQGENAATVVAYLERNRIGLKNVLIDDRLQAGSTFGQRALPTTLFFDAAGRLVSTRIGELSQGVLAQRLSEVDRGAAQQARPSPSAPVASAASPGPAAAASRP